LTEEAKYWVLQLRNKSEFFREAVMKGMNKQANLRRGLWTERCLFLAELHNQKGSIDTDKFSHEIELEISHVKPEEISNFLNIARKYGYKSLEDRKREKESNMAPEEMTAGFEGWEPKAPTDEVNKPKERL
jgi:hypothetical protein